MPTSRPSSATTGRQPPPRVREGVERRLDVDAVVQRHHVADHDVLEPGEAVDAREVGLGDDADRALPDGDERRAVGALVEQDHRLADGRRRVEGDRRVVDEVTRLLPGHDVTHDLGGDVLRDDGEGTAPGGRLGHPAAGDGGHVRDDEGDGRPRAVGAREVDVEAARDRRPVRDHEDVVVRQVELRPEVVEETHPTSVGAAAPGGARPASGPVGGRRMGEDRRRESSGPVTAGCRAPFRSASDAARRRCRCSAWPRSSSSPP